MTAIPRDTNGYSLQACTDPVIALASLLTSEAPPYAKYPMYSEMIGGAVVNAAEAIGRLDSNPFHDFADHLLARVLGGKVMPGKLGPQSGRWASTRQDPIAGHVKLARAILASPDKFAKKAMGAIQWVDQKTQIAMHAKKPATNPDPELLMKRRYAQGVKWVGPIDGIDPFVLTLLGPVGVPLDEAMAMLVDGRARWGLPASPAV